VSQILILILPSYPVLLHEHATYQKLNIYVTFQITKFVPITIRN